MAQSGLSSTIKALEAELGGQLLRRTTRRVELTQAGEVFLAKARHALSAAQAAIDAVAAVEGLRTGSLTVGIMQSLAAIDLSVLLARFHGQYPGIDLRLRQSSSAELVSQVAAGILDLALTSGIDRDQPGLSFVPVFSSPMVLVCAAADPLARRKSVGLAALRDRELVSFPRAWGARMVIEDAFRGADLDRQVKFEVNDVTTLLDLVEAGLGVAVVPDATAQGRPALARVSLAGGPWNWVVSIASVDPSPANPAGQALLRMAKQTMVARS